MQLLKNFYFQLGILVFIYLLYLIALGNNIATTYFLVLLLCSSFVVANKHQNKFANWIRISLYAVLAYYLYGFFTTLPMSIRIMKLWHPDYTILQLVHRMFVDYFWVILLSSIIIFVLVFNKPVQGWFKKLIGKFRGK